jgi:CRP-like cAMP-binding protein
LTSADRPFDPKEFLATVNGGRTISAYRKDKTVFAQGDAADSVFYIQKGTVKVTVLSEQGREAVVAILGPDEFCGEGCLSGQPRRISTATAMTDCEVMRLEKQTMIDALHNERAFSELFLSMSWRARSALKRIWSINSSIQAKSVWQGLCSYWQISARKAGQSPSSQK